MCASIETVGRRWGAECLVVKHRLKWSENEAPLKSLCQSSKKVNIVELQERNGAENGE